MEDMIFKMNNMGTHINREIFNKILTSPNNVYLINNYIDNILLSIPEIGAMIGFEHRHPHHHLDVWKLYFEGH